VQRYVSTAHRYRWLLAAILAVVWGAGLAAAYVEYSTTFESVATIWVLRASPELATSSGDDPSFPVIQAAATQQTDLLNQLLKTKSFVRDVVERTSLRPALEKAPDPDAYLRQIAGRLRVQTLGTNLISVSFAGRDPRVGPEMVRAALAVRAERVTKARIDSATALSALYRREFDVAQTQVVDAQRKLDGFDKSHPAPLSDSDEQQQAQLRLTLNLAQIRANDLKARMDRSVLAPQLLELSGTEFQIVDEAREATAPSGGTRAAASLFGVAFAAGIALAALLVLLGSFLPDHIAGPADVGRIASARLFATVPRFAHASRGQNPDLRATLAAAAFGDGPAADGGKR
jgi:uncharacterized protein involved in exopolysaccharide biosynthesis